MGQLAATQLLAEHGTIVGVQTKGGWTPIHKASFHVANVRVGQQVPISAA